MTILEMTKVSYAYTSAGKQQRILNEVSMQFKAGRFYAILGESGSGKTTALSLLSGLDAPTEGQIQYEGRDLRKIGLTTYRSRHAATVFQSFNLLTYMHALDNVIVALELSGRQIKEKKKRALELLEQVGIDETHAKKNVLQLSGGQQQRVAIARALATEAPIILADEPTGALDEKTATEIIRLFQQLAHDSNRCIIAVTHSAEVARAADQIIELKKQRFVEKKPSIEGQVIPAR
ncbi:ABC transporter ATP-binding protein [Exiguobacterium acetylicum]|uniref:ABC transporter ATP-binding protein n=1 Tax=Exiguobacterium sp. BMC-KP TaxID=1684312 RepID=UPI0006AA335D|nr:ABC transporter ATP-binding protein [Exiguobacterium sp. BMC-KP]KOP29931.1 ABC transporter [Exiguobacterium sp. BMC-KP]